MSAETLQVRYRLGAEELVELGSSTKKQALNRRPFLAGRMSEALLNRSPFLRNRPSSMGIDIGGILAEVGGLIVQGLGFALETLGDFIDLIGQGIDAIFTSAAELLGNIPLIGDVMAQIVLMGNSVIQFGLSIPSQIFHSLGDILGGLGKALREKFGVSGSDQKVEDSKKEIVGKAPPELKDAVKKILDGTRTTGSNLTPNVDPNTGEIKTPTTGPTAEEALSSSSDMNKALAIGVPAIGITALLIALSA